MLILRINTPIDLVPARGAPTRWLGVVSLHRGRSAFAVEGPPPRWQKYPLTRRAHCSEGSKFVVFSCLFVAIQKDRTSNATSLNFAPPKVIDSNFMIMIGFRFTLQCIAIGNIIQPACKQVLGEDPRTACAQKKQQKPREYGVLTLIRTIFLVDRGVALAEVLVLCSATLNAMH